MSTAPAALPRAVNRAPRFKTCSLSRCFYVVCRSRLSSLVVKWLRCFETFLQRVRGDTAVETRCNTARSLLESNNRIAKMKNSQFAPAQSGQSEHSTWPDMAQSHPVANSQQNIVEPATLCNDSIPSSWMCNDVSREYQRCIEIHDSRTTAKG